MKKSLIGLFIALLLMVAIGGGVLLLTDKFGSVSAATDKNIDQIRLASTRDFLYASHQQCPVNDSVLITAHLFKDGKPIKTAGIPVDFQLTDNRFARLDDNRVLTDEWGTASTTLRSVAAKELIPEHPYLVNIKATAEGQSSLITVPLTRYMTLNGSVKDKSGGPVQGATVTLLYNATNKPVSAIGATTTTDIDGKYTLQMVPTDVGDITVYAKKGSLESSMPAEFSKLKTTKP